MNLILDMIEEKVTTTHYASLNQPFTIDDVKEEFSMHPDKAPGPDGLNPAFYQNFWAVVGKDVTNAILNCVDNNGVIPGNNFTKIILIPKKKQLQLVSDLRPISPCKVIDRIVSKMLAKRMKSCLKNCIFEAQSTFIPERFILDNAMIAFEVNHYLKRKTQGTTGFVALKTDMSKAYDRVEWNFLRNMMIKMGFSLDWITKIMKMVCIVSYQISHAGKNFDDIIPSQGLRQGDPYLFIIVAEGLLALLSSYVRQGTLHGVKVTPQASHITHFVFADDALYFFKVVKSETNIIKQCLLLYQKASDQQVNFHKSEIYLSKNTTEDVKDVVASILNVRKVDKPG